MGKKLIITEKPSVARDFARVLKVSGNNNGYIENGEYVVSWCYGHLVQMVYPEEYDIKYKNGILRIYLSYLRIINTVLLNLLRSSTRWLILFYTERI